jgi:hypothetical protein
MTCHPEPERRRSAAMLAAGAFVSALLSFGALAAPAHADEFPNGVRLWQPYDNRGPDKGGVIYFVAPPPLAYATPYTGTPSSYPPPRFYGPGLGLSLPGISIGVQ